MKWTSRDTSRRRWRHGSTEFHAAQLDTQWTQGGAMHRYSVQAKRHSPLAYQHLQEQISHIDSFTLRTEAGFTLCNAMHCTSTGVKPLCAPGIITMHRSTYQVLLIASHHSTHSPANLLHTMWRTAQHITSLPHRSLLTGLIPHTALTRYLSLLTRYLSCGMAASYMSQ